MEFCQEIELRKKRVTDNSTPHLRSDAIYGMSFNQFVDTITKKYNQPHIKVINISYLNEDKAVVTYYDKTEGGDK